MENMNLDESISTDTALPTDLEASNSSKKQQLPHTNFPLISGNRTMHVGTSAGEVANRIIAVSKTSKAERLSRLLDDINNTIVIRSERGFTTYTGTFRGVPMSIIACGIGLAMVDFMVREATYHLKGKVAIVRLGTCGLLDSNIPSGTVILTTSSQLLEQNYDYNPNNSDDKPYVLNGNVNSDPQLFEILKEKLTNSLTARKVRDGANISSETFYSAQGRTDHNFEDFNQNLFKLLFEKAPGAICLDMETFKLLHLASKSRGRIKAAACLIGKMNRISKEIAPVDEMKDSTLFSGFAIMQSLIDYPLD